MADQNNKLTDFQSVTKEDLQALKAKQEFATLLEAGKTDFKTSGAAGKLSDSLTALLTPVEGKEVNNNVSLESTRTALENFLKTCPPEQSKKVQDLLKSIKKPVADGLNEYGINPNTILSDITKGVISSKDVISPQTVDEHIQKTNTSTLKLDSIKTPQEFKVKLEEIKKQPTINKSDLIVLFNTSDTIIDAQKSTPEVADIKKLKEEILSNMLKNGFSIDSPDDSGFLRKNLGSKLDKILSFEKTGVGMILKQNGENYQLLPKMNEKGLPNIDIQALNTIKKTELIADLKDKSGANGGLNLDFNKLMDGFEKSGNPVLKFLCDLFKAFGLGGGSPEEVKKTVEEGQKTPEKKVEKIQIKGHDVKEGDPLFVQAKGKVKINTKEGTQAKDGNTSLSADMNTSLTYAGGENSKKMSGWKEYILIPVHINGGKETYYIAQDFLNTEKPSVKKVPTKKTGKKAGK